MKRRNIHAQILDYFECSQQKLGVKFKLAGKL